MKVLLTGYTGNLGRHIARVLRRHGYRVRVVLHQHTVTRNDFNEEADELLWGTLEDPLLMEKALSGVDAVVHCAWRFNKQTAARPTDNEKMTEMLFRKSLKAGAQFFAFLSSVAVYGMVADNGKPVDETSELDSEGFIYPSEKIETEKILKETEHYPMKLGIFRPGPIIDDDSCPFKMRIGSIAIGFGTGRNPVPFIHAVDVAEAIVLWLKDGKHDDVFNITPSKTLKPREWYPAWGEKRGLKLKPLFIKPWFLRCAAWGANGIKMALRKSGKVDVKYAIAAATRTIEYSNSHLTRELGWQPRKTDEMVEESR